MLVHRARKDPRQAQHQPPSQAAPSQEAFHRAISIPSAPRPATQNPAVAGAAPSAISGRIAHGYSGNHAALPQASQGRPKLGGQGKYSYPVVAIAR